MNKLDHESGAQDDRSTVISKSLLVSHADLRHALQVTSAFLNTIAEHFGVNENTCATIHHDGKVLARMSLRHALDLADAALEPDHQQQLSDDRPGGTSDDALS